MRKEQNDCCGCSTAGYPCIGDDCELKHAIHLFCDECYDETDQLYDYDDEELCEDCLKKKARIEI